MTFSPRPLQFADEALLSNNKLLCTSINSRQVQARNFDIWLILGPLDKALQLRPKKLLQTRFVGAVAFTASFSHSVEGQSPRASKTPTLATVIKSLQ